MSYEAQAHAVQMKVLRYLLMHQEASFGALRKTSDMQSDQFTFHLKQLVTAGYVAKSADGDYYLSRAGKEYANRMDTDEHVIEKQAKLSVVLIVEREDGLWLHQKRLKHPYFGYWGHPTGKVRWGETFVMAAERELLEETGLTADMRVVGIFHKLDVAALGGELLEDKLLVLTHGTRPRGELKEEVEGHQNAWMTFEEYEAKDKKFGSVAESIQLVHADGQFVHEDTYRYDLRDY